MSSKAGARRWGLVFMEVSSQQEVGREPEVGRELGEGRELGVASRQQLGREQEARREQEVCRDQVCREQEEASSPGNQEEGVPGDSRYLFNN